MSGEKVTVSIDQAGNVSWDAEGFTGQSCEEATKVLEMAFQGGSRSENKKPEYYEAESVSGERQLNRF